MPFVNHCGSFLLVAATILLIVATISSPITKPIYLFRIVRGTGEGVRFGVFGACVGNGSNMSSGYLCSSRQIGYAIADRVNRVTSSNVGQNWGWMANITKVFVLHPVAAGLSFLALVISACSHRFGYMFASCFTLLAFLVSVVCVAVDFALFSQVKRKVNNDTDASADYGVAIWLVLASAVCLLFAFFANIFSICRGSDKHRYEATSRGVPLKSRNQQPNYDEPAFQYPGQQFPEQKTGLLGRFRR